LATFNMKMFYFVLSGFILFYSRPLAVN